MSSLIQYLPFRFESWQKKDCRMKDATSLLLYQIYSTPLLKKEQDHSVKVEKEKLPFEVSQFS